LWGYLIYYYADVESDCFTYIYSKDKQLICFDTDVAMIYLNRGFEITNTNQNILLKIDKNWFSYMFD
jgi:hypothetical protein